jgi:hypothetical protein
MFVHNFCTVHRNPQEEQAGKWVMSLTRQCGGDTPAGDMNGMPS